MQFDLVSDLHVDFWDDETNRDWLSHKKSDILVVAGDTSDNPGITFDFLNELCQHYKTVMYVDGNHEHQKNLDRVFKSDLQFRKDSLAFCDAFYLPTKDVIIDDVAFVGANGWWSFDFGVPNMPKEDCVRHYQEVTGFTNASLDEQKSIAHRDADYLYDKIASLSGNPKIKSIIIVTHTLPHRSCISWNEYPPDKHFTGLYGNTRHEEVLDYNHKNKLGHWIFGHNHDQKNLVHGSTRLISNPRGRPSDYNREIYRPLTITV